MARSSKRTSRRDKRFFDLLTATGQVTHSAQTSGYGRRQVYMYRADDEVFAERWDDALAVYLERLEAEADRRAIEGTIKPVFYQGIECGQIREFSDTLLMFRAKRLDPLYRDRVDHTSSDGSMKPQPTVIEIKALDGPDTNG